MKIAKIILAVAVASATAAGSAVGVAEHKIAGAERKRLRDENKRLRDERHQVVKTEAVKSRFGKTKFVNRIVTVDGYGKEV